MRRHHDPEHARVEQPNAPRRVFLRRPRSGLRGADAYDTSADTRRSHQGPPLSLSVTVAPDPGHRIGVFGALWAL